MLAQLPNIILCMALCNITWAFFFFGMHRKGVDYTRHYWWTAGYFLSSAVITSLIFWQYVARALQDVALAPLVALVVFMTAQAFWYVYFPAYVPEPKEYFEAHPDRFYLKIDWRRLISKSMDIMAQQVFIVLLVLFLKDAGLSFVHILIAFCVLFALLHFPLITSERGAWPSWLFAGIVVVFSIIFPTLILTVPYGFVYNYILHWLFYTITGSIFWITHSAPSLHARKG